MSFAPSLNDYPLIEPKTITREIDSVHGAYRIAQCPDCTQYTLWDCGWTQPMSPPNRLHICLACDHKVLIHGEKGFPRPISPIDACDHNYVDPSNEKVEANGYLLCIKCGTLKPPK